MYISTLFTREHGVISVFGDKVKTKLLSLTATCEPPATKAVPNTKKSKSYVCNSPGLDSLYLDTVKC